MAQSKLRFDDLPDDMIIEIFSRLPVNKLLPTQTVSRDWSRCVDKTLNRVEVVAFGYSIVSHRFDDKRCQHLRQIDLTRTLLIHGHWIYPERKPSLYYFPISTAMLPLLSRCPQVKCLVLDANYHYLDKSHIKFEDIDTLRRLLNAFPQLECLYYGLIEINEFDDADWQLLCQEIGPRIKHLALDGPLKREKTIYSLMTASVNLEVVYLKGILTKKFYFEPLLNRPSIDLTIEFIGPVTDGEVDADTAAVINRAKDLSIQFPCLQSVASHFPKFGRLEKLKIKYEGVRAPIEQFAVELPVLEHLDWTSTVPNMIITFLNNSLPGLKSLTIANLTEDLLTALAGKLTSLEKLHFKCCIFGNFSQLPTDSLLLLKSLVDLRVTHSIYSKNYFVNVIQLFKVATQLAEMKRLKRCQIKITSPFKSIPGVNNLKQQLIQAQANLRKALPFVEIYFPLEEWPGKISKKIE